MDKEEILSKSRKEHLDEGMDSAENNGIKIGITAFCIVFIFIVVFNFFHGLPNYAPLALFWAFAAAEAYPVYTFTKKKAYLLTTVAGTMACIANLVNFVLSVIK